MAKDLNKYYSHFNWGPFIAKFACPKNVLKRLDAEGKQAERSWNHQLAGHIKSQFKWLISVDVDEFIEMEQNIEHLCITAVLFLHISQPCACHLRLSTQVSYHPY